MNPEIVGIFAGFFTTIATLPQIIKAYKTKSLDDVSLLMFVSIVFGLALWLIYGILIQSFAIIMWNVISLTLNSVILIQKIYYTKR